MPVWLVVPIEAHHGAAGLTVLDYPKDSGGRLKALQAAVGGYIELVRLGGGVDAFCDEEGLLKGLAPSWDVRRADGLEIRLVGPVAFEVRAKTPQAAAEAVMRAAVPLPQSPRKDLAPPAPTPR